MRCDALSYRATKMWQIVSLMYNWEKLHEVSNAYEKSIKILVWAGVWRVCLSRQSWRCSSVHWSYCSCCVCCASSSPLIAPVLLSTTTRQRAVRRVKMEPTRSCHAPSRIRNSVKVGPFTPFHFYRAMLCRARLCRSKLSLCPPVCPSVCLSVCDVPRSHRLEYFENNFTQGEPRDTAVNFDTHLILQGHPFSLPQHRFLVGFYSSAVGLSYFTQLKLLS